MVAVLFLVCVVVGLALYFGVVRPFVVPLTQRIPTGRAYRATLGART